MKVVSLFSGAGGADLGFHLEGFDIVFANDNNKACLETYYRNFRLMPFHGAIQYLDPKIIPDCDIVIGGPPCQSFSNARTTTSKFRHCGGIENVEQMKRIVKAKQPKIFVCENVSTILSSRMLGAFESFINWKGYKVHAYLLSTEDYGIPQERLRYFFVGVREDFDYCFREPKKDHWENHYTGWADFLGVHNKELYKRKNARFPIPANGGAVPTITGADRMVFKWINNFYNVQEWEYLPIEYMAKLQGFPDYFKFCGNVAEVRQQIGNAWSVNVAQAIAKECARCLELMRN